MAEFELGLEEVRLQPGHGTGIETVLSQRVSGRASDGPVPDDLALDLRKRTEDVEHQPAPLRW